MVVLNRFYQITEKPTSQISVWFKVIHIALFVYAAVCGFVAAFAFGQALNDFDYNCVLNPTVVFMNNSYVPVPESHKPLRKIDETLSIWGSQSECGFAQFSPVASMIFAVIWGAFFVIVAKGGAGYSSDILQTPWKIIYPCIIFSILLASVLLASFIVLENGIKSFCASFEEDLGTPECVEDINLYTLQFGDGKKDIYLALKIARICSSQGVQSWFFQLIVLIVRVLLVTDFELHVVTISDKEEERVEQVIEFHEDDESSGAISQV